MRHHTASLAGAGLLAVLIAGLSYGPAFGGGQGQKGLPGQQGGYQGGIGQTPWFSNPQVRQQFKLTDQQYNALNQAYGTAWQQYQQGIQGLDKGLTDAQRAQRIQEMQQGFYRNFGTNLSQTINDPQQLQRFQQMQLQYRGYGAFSDPTVQEKLKLTPEQRQKLGQYGTEWEKEMTGLAQGYEKDPTAAGKRFSELQTQAGERLNTILTPEQQRAWQEMTGPRYTFQPGIYFPANPGTGKDRK